MKNRHIESLRHKAREYHRNHQWRLENGLRIPHAYLDERREDLSWWDDVGFILNDRRVIVHWVHPRYVYSNAIEDRAQAEIPPPAPHWRHEGGEKKYRKLGRSRKKVIGIAGGRTPPAWSDYFDALRAREDELTRSGIDLDIRPSMRVSLYRWATAVDLIAPIEVRSRDDIALLAAIARRLLKRETTVANEWPGYRYGQVDWLAEAERRQ
ncbi:hypothetical protein [Paraburkholderia adhaesiva]|uniref:hypothetical protein n=1 Tax=Paraburkholderia adhaesiva TaxID=2883244 RepID=UPI001F364D2F|nr:hypothetical protein [Paraburkholderia adhaesiva]